MNHSSKYQSKNHIREPSTFLSQEKGFKPKYEKPILLSLGDIPSGSGAACNPGSTPDNPCITGSTAAKNCNTGYIVIK